MTITVVMPAGEGELVAIIDPESGRTEHLAYDREVTLGTITLADGVDQEMIFTRTFGNGDALGIAISSRGEAISLKIQRPAGDARESQFVLLSTETGTAISGTCVP